MPGLGRPTVSRRQTSERTVLSALSRLLLASLVPQVKC